MLEFIFLVLVLASSRGAAGLVTPKFTPVSYNLSIQIDPQNGKLQGNVSISVHVKEELATDENIELDMDSEYLYASSCEINREDAECRPVNKKLSITVKPTIKSINTISVQFERLTPFSKQSTSDDGIFSLSYSDSQVIATNFYPNKAHKVFPCFDDPTLLARFTVKLQQIPGWDAYSNMPKKNGSSDGWSFKTTPKIAPSSFMFFLEQNYAQQNIIEGTWVHYPKSVDKLVSDNKFLRSVLAGDYFNEYARDCNLNEIKIVMIPDLPEDISTSYGIIAMSPELMVLEKDATTKDQSDFTLSLLNAYAKLFFGAVVVPAAPEDSWLSNSLAIYLQFKAMKKFSEWEEQLVDNLEYAAMSAAFQDEPISVIQSSAVQQNFEKTGIKGAAFLRMLEDIEGINMEEFLRNTVWKEKKHKPILTNDFLDMLSSCAPLENFNFHPWVYNRGYPFLNVALVPDNPQKCSIEVSWPKTSGGVEVPVKYITDMSPTDPKTVMVGVHPGTNDCSITRWILVNSNGRGLYRVKYDINLYKELSKAMKNKELKGAIERSVLLSSVFYYARQMDSTDSASVLELADNIMYEFDYAPWAVFAQSVIEIRNFLIDGKIYEDFRAGLSALVRKPFSLFGFKANRQSSCYEKIRRGLIVDLACEIGLDECLSEAQKVFVDIKDISPEDYQKFIDDYGADTLNTIKCTGVSNLKDSEWNDYFKKHYNSQDPRKKREHVLNILACGQFGSIENLLKEINEDDKFNALTAIYKRPVNIKTMLTYLSKNVMTDEWAQVVDGISQMVSNVDDFQKIDALRENVNREEYRIMWMSINNAIFTESRNELWLNNHSDELRKWLGDVPTDSPPTEQPSSSEPPSTSTTPRPNKDTASQSRVSASVLIASVVLIMLRTVE